MQGIASLNYTVQEQPLIPQGGLQKFQDAAEMLADFGREGDTYIVHAAEGETVIPVEVLDANPRMKAMLFKQMEDMGLEPERYVVGNELNSINPVTGQPEFFLKKLFSGIKKAIKAIAPIALPIVAPFLLPTLPVALSSGLGSFAASKLRGASTGDALKGALISGGLAGLGSFAKGKGFLGTGRDIGVRGIFDRTPKTSPVNVSPATNQIDQLAGQAEIIAKGFPQPELAAANLPVQAQPATGLEGLETANPITEAFKKYVYDPAPNVMDASGQTSGESLLESYLSPSRTSLSPEAATVRAAEGAQQSIDVANLALENRGQPPLTPDQQTDMITKAITSASTKYEDPSLLKKLAPAGIAGLGLLTAYDSTRPPVDENGDNIDDITGQMILNRDIEQGIYQYGIDPNTFYGDNPFYQRIQAADGGEIVGPGTGTSDSIPALLSDGEFVMTANAVKGAGGGDRTKGAKRMYQMMKQYEGRA